MSTNLLGVKLGQRWCLNHTTANSDAQSDVFFVSSKIYATRVHFIYDITNEQENKSSIGVYRQTVKHSRQ